MQTRIPTIGDAARLLAVVQEIDAWCAGLRAGGYVGLAEYVEGRDRGAPPDASEPVRVGLACLREAVLHAQDGNLGDALTDVRRAFERMATFDDAMNAAYCRRRGRWNEVDDAMLALRAITGR